MSTDLHTAINAAAAASDLPRVAALCAERLAAVPDDHRARQLLAFTLGDAGQGAAAIEILKATAEHLVRQGYLLAAIGVIKKGMERAPAEKYWRDTLARLHVRAARDHRAQVRTPPPLPRATGGSSGAVSADELLAAGPEAVWARAAEVGRQLPPAGAPVPPAPLPLFSDLEAQSFGVLVQRSTYLRLSAGQTFIDEGQAGDALYLVAEGEVEVLRGAQAVARLGSGAVVGEMALVTNAPRTATVRALGDCELFEVKRELLDEMTREAPRVRDELLEFVRMRMLDNVLRTSPLFKGFDDAGRARLLAAFERRAAKPGEVILAEGQPGVGLFLIAAGQVAVSAAGDGGERVKVAILGVRDVFGEISLLHERPVTATVTAEGQVGLLVLPRAAFRAMVEAHPEVAAALASLSEERLKATDAARSLEDLTDFILL